MKTLILTILCVFSMSVCYAKTIVNKDHQNYKLEVVLKNGSRSIVPIHSGATNRGMCNSGGCAIRILETGSTILLTNKNDATIQNGQIHQNLSEIEVSSKWEI